MKGKALHLLFFLSKTSLVLFFFLFQFDGAITNQIENLTGCGGFVIPTSNLSDSLKKMIDYSKIKVKMSTLQGNTKETTECAPNGYYFLPVYDKGNFLIQIEGPVGWTFEPSEVAVSISSEDNQCKITANGAVEDINFKFRPGFSISGFAVGEGCPNKNKGPRGLTVSLISKESQMTPITVSTDDKGHYIFNNIFPGKYQITASHPSWSISKATTEVTVGWDSVQVPTSFVVSGFNVYGSVVSSDEPVQGVELYLYSTNVKQIQGCIPVDTKNGEKALCLIKSSTDGKFEFNNIPCGDFTLVPFYKGANTVFDVSPKSLSFTVDQESLELPHFQVMGFSVSGRVTDNNGQGIEGVSIEVDGKIKVVTDSTGTYKLDQLRSGQSYQISASKPHMKFSTPKSIKVSPNTPLPDIRLESYSLCGKVIINQQPSNLVLKKSIRLLDSNKKEISRATWDDSGMYCFDVVPGNYIVEPLQDPKEQAAGFLVHPTQLPVSIQNTPFLNANFGQAMLTLGGKVKCLEKNCGGKTVSISLSNSNGGSISTQEVDSEGHFKFSGIFPGKYKASIDNKENWCWDKDVQEITLSTSNISNLEFGQTGYMVNIKVSNDIKLLYSLDKKSEERALTRGANQFCLPKPGIYTLTPSSCYKFDKDDYSYDTSHPTQLNLEARKYLVRGMIVQTKDAQKTSSFQVAVSKVGTEEAPLKVDATLVRTEKDRAVYEYKYYAELKDKLKFKPVFHSVFLFYPESQSVTISQDECPLEVPPFEARPGLFFAGKIVPAITDVDIHVIEEATAERLVSLKSTADGSFSVGPLYDDKKYSLIAEKPGYKFERNDGWNFKALKLGQLLVTVLDKDKVPVPGVLLSLSEYKYHTNNITQLNGSFTFINLSPGQYFLKPLLKEFVFEPSSMSVEIADGSDTTVTFTATRVAYSCYGSISSLNGEPEKFVTIEAVGSNGEHEETQSDISGQYRLRGLVPGILYEVRVKEDANIDQRVERATPKSVPVKVTNDNINNINFIVFRRASRHSISGVVETDSQWLSKLTVQLYKEDSTSPVKYIPLGPSNFFDFTSLEKGNYSIKIKSSLPSDIYVVKSSEISVDLHQSVTDLHLKFSASLNSGEINELSSTPLFSLIFGVVVIISIFYYPVLIEFYQNIILGKKKREHSSNESWLPKGLKR